MNPLRTSLFAALGLLVGGLASSAFTGCACPDAEVAEVPAGVYVAADDAALEADWRLEVAADRASAVETFTHEGKVYEVRYAVTVQAM